LISKLNWRHPAAAGNELDRAVGRGSDAQGRGRCEPVERARRLARGFDRIPEELGAPVIGQAKILRGDHDTIEPRGKNKPQEMLGNAQNMIAVAEGEEAPPAVDAERHRTERHDLAARHSHMDTALARGSRTQAVSQPRKLAPVATTGLVNAVRSIKFLCRSCPSLRARSPRKEAPIAPN